MVKKIKELIREIDNFRLYLILIIGSFLRLFYIGNIPGNKSLYGDEMLDAYESWSLINYGYDYKGYHFPVYLPSWGTGMNALQAYIQMPFIKLFGLNSFSVRLPAAIIGCITLYAFYYICKKIKSTDFAVFATFILAVMPWHIILSRWSIECNIFAGFITFSIALIIKACENEKFLPLAFFFIGISLYAYALTWTIMPIFVLSITIYLIVCHKVKIDRYLFISLGVLVLVALPLLLFVMVNFGVIPEIVTPFISIPQLKHFRSDEIITSYKDLLRNFYTTLSCFVSQDDGYLQNSTPMFGLYYKFSNIFILLGIAKSFLDYLNNDKSRFHYDFMFIVLFICSVIVGSTVEISFYRMNMIHIPMTYFLAVGLWLFIEEFQKKAERIVVFIYIISCICFLTYYVTYQDDRLAKVYLDGTEQALSYIHELKASDRIDNDATVNIYSITFAAVLYYDQYPTDKYIKEVVYEDNQITGLRELAKSFGQYNFIYDFDPSVPPNTDEVYLCAVDDYDVISQLEEYNMTIEYFSYVAVAYTP